MRITGAYFPEVHGDGVLMSKLAEAAYTVMGLEGFRVPYDLCIEAEAFGCELKPGNSESPPSVIRPAENVFFPEDCGEIFKRGRFPVIFKALSELRSKYANRLPIYGGVVGPITLAGHLFGPNQILRLMIKDPERVSSIFSDVCTFSSCYANRMLEAGANVVFIIDPTASGDMISPRHFERFLLPAYRLLRKNITAPIILHICGDTSMHLRFIADSGFEGFSFDGAKVTAAQVAEVLRGRMTICGDIPVDLMLHGQPREIQAAAFKAMDHGVHIVMTSCGIPIHSPMANVTAMVEAVKAYNEGKN